MAGSTFFNPQLITSNNSGFILVDNSTIHSPWNWNLNLFSWGKRVLGSKTPISSPHPWYFQVLGLAWYCFWKEVSCLLCVFCVLFLWLLLIFSTVSLVYLTMLSVLFLGLFLLINFSPHSGLYFLASLCTLWIFSGCQTFEFYFVGGCFLFVLFWCLILLICYS